MSWRHALALLAILGAAGCASEGGVTGTGISASVSGNVVAVDAAAAALPFPIRVTVAEAPAVTTVTADDGTFALTGQFSGAITLQFSNAASGAALGPLPLEIPAGSVTVLENIEIDTAAPEPDRIRPRAVRQFDIGGRIDLVECGTDGTLLVTDGARPARQFLIALTADTEIVSGDGAPLDCTALRAGRRVRVEGFLRLRTQTLVATQVIVGPLPAPSPDAPRRERFRGAVAAVACDVGQITLVQLTDGDAVRRQIRLTPDTEILCGADARPCRCAAIDIGDGLRGSGTIFPRAPGVVVADTVTVFPAAGPVTSVVSAVKPPIHGRRRSN